MNKKGVLLISLGIVLLIALSYFIFFTELIPSIIKPKVECEKPNILINGTCAPDSNLNFIDDAKEGLVCGDGQCHEQTENCSTCWQDCGVCKVTTYIYYPTNFSLKNITPVISQMYDEDVKFRKDIEVNDEVSDHFYYDYQVPKYIADFFGIQYHPLRNHRHILISKIKLDQWYLNNTETLKNWTNQSKWYLIQQPLNSENEFYTNRFVRNIADKRYPRE